MIDIEGCIAWEPAATPPPCCTAMLLSGSMSHSMGTTTRVSCGLVEQVHDIHPASDLGNIGAVEKEYCNGNFDIVSPN